MKRVSYNSPFSHFYPLRSDIRTKLRFFLDSFAYNKEEYIEFRDRALNSNLEDIVSLVQGFEERHKNNRQAAFLHAVFNSEYCCGPEVDI